MFAELGRAICAWTLVTPAAFDVITVLAGELIGAHQSVKVRFGARFESSRASAMCLSSRLRRTSKSRPLTSAAHRAAAGAQ